MNTDELARRILNSLKPPAIDDGWIVPSSSSLVEKIEYLLTDAHWKDTPRAARVRELLEIARQRKARGEKPHE